MFRGPWTLRHGCVRYELALGGLAPQGDELEAAFIVAAALDDWLRDGWAERTICELASALGVERPWVLNDLTVLDYHDRIKARVRNALELGWLQVRTLQESRVAYALSERPSQSEKTPERPIEAEDLWLTVQTMSGDPVEDDAGFVLSKPDRSTEAVRLSAGEFRKLRVPRGSYQARFTYLRDARWQQESIRCGEEVQMTVSAPGFPDGASVRFAVYESSQLGDSQPIAEVQAPVSGGEASASWRHVQKLGEPAGRLPRERLSVDQDPRSRSGRRRSSAGSTPRTDRSGRGSTRTSSSSDSRSRAASSSSTGERTWSSLRACSGLSSG